MRQPKVQFDPKWEKTQTCYKFDLDSLCLFFDYLDSVLVRHQAHCKRIVSCLTNRFIINVFIEFIFLRDDSFTYKQVSIL